MSRKLGQPWGKVSVEKARGTGHLSGTISCRLFGHYKYYHIIKASILVGEIRKNEVEELLCELTCQYRQIFQNLNRDQFYLAI